MLNHLPHETRLIEIVSAMTLIIAGFLSIWTQHVFFTDSMTKMQVSGFWAVTISIFGTLQLACALIKGRLEMVRGVLSWVVGSFWTWLALETMVKLHTGIPEINLFLLGLSNIYAFIVNAVITLREDVA